ncbi:hypothetical protein NG895_01515 [Aeoliella sp. ICT_H6.2]|uniref:Uncharacterized protein n=1 Tax=Aeoliella straminimaris TaxID=2954799 RepID=A0A9X2FA86_9BACT|nr:hypothetical protein [Aeoliella straminimaris]MCO6042574.1 hypothetical protein [Aeoliella straminimaris]
MRTHVTDLGGGVGGAKPNRGTSCALVAAIDSHGAAFVSQGSQAYGATVIESHSFNDPWHAATCQIDVRGRGEHRCLSAAFEGSFGLQQQQQDALAAGAGDAQQEPAAGGVDSIQGRTSCPSLSANCSTSSGGRTASLRAHSRRWAMVWQQQLVQQTSAELHPQPQISQGKRSDDSRASCGRGSGTPVAAAAKATSNSAAIGRRWRSNQGMARRVSNLGTESHILDYFTLACHQSQCGRLSHLQPTSWRAAWYK